MEKIRKELEERLNRELREAKYFEQSGDDVLKLVHREKAKVYEDVIWMLNREG